MEQASSTSTLGDSEGILKNSFANISGKERNAWRIPLGSSVYHGSSDASLFSSSLPVLPHAKLIYGDSEVNLQMADDGLPDLGKHHLDDEGKDAWEFTESSPAGNLLPGDEEELLAGIMDDFDLCELPTQLEDLEDDLFGSGGGLEMEAEHQKHALYSLSTLSLSDDIPGNSTGHYAVPNGVGTIAGEHPYGEHPYLFRILTAMSRTLN